MAIQPPQRMQNSYVNQQKKGKIVNCLQSRGDRESGFLGFRVASGLDTISRPFPSGIGKFEIVFFGQLEVVPDF